MKKKEIKHRVTSVAKLHANCRGEVVVHTMKKMIRVNFTIRGKLDMDKFSSPLVVHNTRHRDTNISPVKFPMERKSHDFLHGSKEHLALPGYTERNCAGR